jgi:hypothetical protein
VDYLKIKAFKNRQILLSLQTKKIILAVLTIMVLDKLQRIQDSIKKDKKQESRNLLIQKHFRKLKNSDLEDQKITMMMILKLERA